MFEKSYNYTAALDTNILVRYIVKDDLVQFKKIHHYFKTRISLLTPFLITQITICELVWVLESRYKYNKAEIISTIAKINKSIGFEIEKSGYIMEALKIHRNSNVGFTDCLIGINAREKRAKTIITLDEKASKLKFYQLLE